MASEQVPVASERVPVRTESGPVASQQVLIGYEFTPRGTLGVKTPPVSLYLTSSHNAEMGIFCE